MSFIDRSGALTGAELAAGTALTTGAGVDDAGADGVAARAEPAPTASLVAGPLAPAGAEGGGAGDSPQEKS